MYGIFDKSTLLTVCCSYNQPLQMFITALALDLQPCPLAIWGLCFRKMLGRKSISHCDSEIHCESVYLE